MNSGGAGSYNKVSGKRRLSPQLTLARSLTTSLPGAAGPVVTSSSRRNQEQASTKSSNHRRGGQLQLQSVSRAPLVAAAAPAPGNSANAYAQASRSSTGARHQQHHEQRQLYGRQGSNDARYPPQPYATANAVRTGAKVMDNSRGQNAVEVPSRSGAHVSSSSNSAQTPGDAGRKAPQRPQYTYGREASTSSQPRTGAVPVVVAPGQTPHSRAGVGGAGNVAARSSKSSLSQHQGDQRSSQSQSIVHPPRPQVHVPSCTTPAIQWPQPSASTSSGRDLRASASGMIDARKNICAQARDSSHHGIQKCQADGRTSTEASQAHTANGVRAPGSKATSRPINTEEGKDRIGAQMAEAPALRACLAEVEARHAEMAARVQELEERNFDLEASMQMIEVEAAHRVEKQAKALQSELSFKDHQLKQAQSSHTSAMRDLNAERSKRKADRQQPERQREDAAAGAAAIDSAPAAATPAAVSSVTTAQNPASATGPRSRESPIRPTYAGAAEQIPLPTLADTILTDSQEDVMVLLNAVDACGLPRRSGQGIAYSGGFDSDYGVGHSSGARSRSRGSGRDWSSRDPFSSPGLATMQAVSPVSGSSGWRSLGAKEAARIRGASGVSPVAPAFTPVRSSSSRRSPWREDVTSAGAGSRPNLANFRAGDFSDGRRWAKSASPRARNDAEREAREGYDCVEADDVVWQEMLRSLSSQLLICAMAVAEGEACAGDLLAVLVSFVDVLPPDVAATRLVLVSAMRLLGQTLAATPQASSAVSFGGTPLPERHTGSARPGVTGASASSAGGPRTGQGSPVRANGKGTGRKRRRGESGSTASSAGGGDADERERGVVDSEPDPTPREAWPAKRPCSVFVAGKPLAVPIFSPAAEDVSTSRVPCRATASASDRGGESYARENPRGLRRVSCKGWAGERDGEELGRRIRVHVVALLHRGVWCGCPALVEACLQVVVCVLWDKRGEDLSLWRSVLEHGSISEIMLSELHRSAWRVGAQVLRILTRNRDFFRCLVTGVAPQAPAPSEGDASQELVAHGSVPATESATPERTTIESTAMPPSTLGPEQDENGSQQGGKQDANGSLLRQLCADAIAIGEDAAFGSDVELRLSVIRLVFHVCQKYGAEIAPCLFASDEQNTRSDVAEESETTDLIPALVTFVRLELEDWERRRYSQPAPVQSGRDTLLKEAFQLLWTLAMHAPLSLRDMAQGAGVFNTMVSVVSRFYNSVEMEEFQVHKEAMMLMEKMN